MANDCLVMKLKTSVSREDLSHLGCIKFTANVTSITPDYNNFKLIAGSNGCTINIISGIIYRNAAYSNSWGVGKHTIDAGVEQILYFNKTDAPTFIIEDKYTAVSALMGTSNGGILFCFTANPEEFVGISELKYLYTNLVQDDFDVENFIERDAAYITTTSDTPFVLQGSRLKLNGSTTYKLTTYYCLKDTTTSLISIYKTRTGEEGSYIYSDIVATFNYSTREWTYNE